MELGRSSSTREETIARLGAGPRSSPLGKLQALPIGPGAHPGAPGSSASAGDSSVGEPSGAMKIPNRDSGIDSPSSSVASENFPCEEGSEGSPGPATLGLHPVTAVDSQVPQDTPQEEEDSGVGEEPDPKITPSRPEENAGLAQCSDQQKLLNIAQELLHTEEAYVRRLHLLDQGFCTKLTEAGIPPEVTTGIFSNISSIYRFHGQFLLPELQKRITEEWDTNPRLGDILQKLAPFLKMYGEYVKNFDRAMGLVSSWTHRSPQFKDVIHSIQKQEECGNLTLQHHMLEPVQRVPRYELLLKDYLKRLPRDAPDRKDAERSLELISTAADHSNAAIRKMEKMHKLLEVYEQLGGEEDIVNPANELIKEGNIQKLSAKNGTTQDRHLFLFNNVILYCVPKLRLMGQKFSVREKMDISDLQVQDVVKPNAAHTFIITGRKRSLELQTRTEEEKKEWVQVIQATVEKHRQKSETFRAFGGACSQDEEPTLSPDQPILSANSAETAGVADSSGGTAGVESKKLSSKTRRDKEKPGCKSCGETFNSFTKRRHRCKLCGQVICRKCSEFKAENSKQSRVCRECFLEESLVPASPSSETCTELKQNAEKPPSVDPRPSLVCSTLRLSDNGTAWSEVWADIPESDPQVLVLLAGRQAGRLLHTIPLSGCTVTVPDSEVGLEAGCVWKLHQGPQTWWLSAPSTKLQQCWLEALSTAGCGDTAGDRPGASQPQASASTSTP
ncbi:FYVE, RhoGEF and PH domain-containing protein 3 [Mesocricetus auratus]|uniref:FYVE, RhoGEF and PH domain-containing protein 3 n=1 Tax=Mesocricetus auratus TaxID=10036 RepID=A0A1U8BIV1_MESAU|nr:FYVE, RhoGEF and PH domain-containing protein 3 [Mesocricetus auratus]XP_012966124.1 FYVE, RhoGEF and PH domain-containing protein 3 [Mesocricetus auratus]XP_012966125.1 FYVE, RhoGEF and PH domain-containing protein 3 [Mesocricetus auratus]XP_021080588.1 FYVE, RhoGEF and PH domain-containing protein 3 [Mesocricetus auratus]XP_021080590.1 FYVE, RhoGEF and PH domain-containing protein 3 [Mesocricetus auratus]XP_040611882.1 FYVE, RhoGEF and PH domain-containing protein 3 [Mesocricetus auratus]